MLSINQPLFLQKKPKPLYPNIYLGLGLGFEFEPGPQRIILIVKPLLILPSCARGPWFALRRQLFISSLSDDVSI
jgi:hypothetical protein